MMHKLSSAIPTGVAGLVLTCGLAQAQTQIMAPTEGKGGAKVTGQNMTSNAKLRSVCVAYFGP